jgi:hypothetical protein
MKNRSPLWAIPVWLCLAVAVGAQEKRPPTDAVEGIKGVKEDAVAKVKNVETGTTTATRSEAQGVNKIDGIDTINGVKADGRTVVPPVNAVVPPPVAGTAVNVETGTATGTTSNAKGVNKIDGIDTINGVKADGRTAVPPVKSVVPPPVAGTAVQAGGGTVGSGGTIQAVNGVAGINAARLRNLEAALKLKHEGQGTPSDQGKAAAAALLGAGPAGPKPGPKADGRDQFQEFEKLPNTGS